MSKGYVKEKNVSKSSSFIWVMLGYVLVRSVKRKTYVSVTVWVGQSRVV